MPVINVAPFDLRHRREGIAVLARAFWNDPLFDVFAKDLLHEQRMLPGFFGALLDDAISSDPTSAKATHSSVVWAAVIDGRPRGLACWLAPGSYPRSKANDARLQLRALGVIARSRHRRMALRLVSALDEHHPHDPHWYLSVLGVDPSLQGRGAGSALLTPVLDRCDAEGLPAYLETQKESNLAWYARTGFEVVNEIRIPKAPPVWCLRREPRR